jgi:hypothetical protein
MADVVRAGNREEAKAVVRPAFCREISLPWLARW